MRRFGFSITEVLVALAVLSFGFLPLFQLLRGTRGVLGQTREMLVLERRAIEALAHGAGLAEMGKLRDLGEAEERSFDLSSPSRPSEDGVRGPAPESRCALTVARVAGRKLLRLTARCETRARQLTLSRELFDPLASYWGPAEPLPEPSEEGGR
jgi:prepilin-type N-terminal cleavage/methylation domain-containing protein